MDNEYISGRRLCEKLGVPMYQRIAIQRIKNGQVFGEESEYFISPLGVAVRCSDDVGLFEENLSRELFNGKAIIYDRYGDFVSPKRVRYNKEWVEELALKCGVNVRTKRDGVVGAMEVPAVRFRKWQYG